MAKFTSAWLIGSVYLPETEINIASDGTDEDYVITAGHYYLYHKESALSLVDIMVGFIEDKTTFGSCFLAKDRRVRMQGGTLIDVTWPTSLAKLFGFTGNVSGAGNYSAPSVSPLLWSASKPETPQESPLGTRGARVYDTKFSVAPDTTAVATGHHTQTKQTFAWSYVPTDRYQTASQDADTPGTLQGEYTRFYDQVLVRAEKFFLYRNVAEDTSSSDPVGFESTELGPYILRPGRGTLGWDLNRASGFKDVERRVNVSLDCLGAREWGA